MRNFTGRRSRVGVTEVLGFVLIFSLVAATTGIVYVYGVGGLEDTRDRTVLANAERAMDVLADNLLDIHRDGVPNRATEVKLYDAQLYLSEPRTWKVYVNETDGDPLQSYSIDVEPVVYTADDTDIVYSNGAIIREDRGGAIMKHEPPFVFRQVDGEPVAIVPIIQTRSRTEQNVGGDGTVLVRSDLAISETTGADTAANYSGTSVLAVNLTFETTSGRVGPWERHLDEEIGTAYGVSDPCERVGSDSTTVACEFDVKRVYVGATRIGVEITA